jgi:hypothetical protein
MTPPRTSICIVCRTALLPEEPCDQGGGHQVLSMLDAAGRDGLLAVTWGDAAMRAQHVRLTASRQRAGGAGAIAGFTGALAAMLATIPGPDHALHLAVGLIVGGIGWSLGRGSAAATPFPIGAAASPRIPIDGRGAVGPRGEVAGTCDLTSPASGTECVGYAIELRVDAPGGQRTMLRDAVTAGFTIHLDGGGVAVVPAGRMRLVGAMQQEVDVDNVVLDAHLRSILPTYAAENPFDPIYHNMVCEQLILPGDVVELVGSFEPRPSRHAEATMYREAPPSVLAPRGIPLLRVVGGLRS